MRARSEYARRRLAEVAETGPSAPAPVPALTPRLYPAWVRDIHKRARKNARERGIPFLLTADDVRVLYDRSGGRCEVTGLPFDIARGQLSRFERNPFAPSLDRIDAGRAYHAANCRLVCLITNMALGTWGISAFDQMARSYVALADAARKE